MQLLVTTADDAVFNLDVSDEMNLEDFLALCRHESVFLQRFSTSELSILFNGCTFHNMKQTLREIGLKSGDLLLVTRNPLNISSASASNIPSTLSTNDVIASLDFSNIRPTNKQDHSNAQISEGPSIRMLFDQLVNDQPKMNRLRHNDPELAAAAQKKDYGKFSTIIKQRLEARKHELEKRRRILADPFSPEAQQLLLQDIHRQQIDEHMQIALEHTPENFGVVTMLYVSCKVNGHDIKAFVDSGAQTTIMSEACAKSCNILHLVDRRFAGIAQGVGTSKIMGRIHLGQLQIGKDYLPTSFTVLENQNVDLLLGLDMLRRHQCCIDLKRNKLVIGTTGGETDFLPESELPPSARQPKTPIDDDVQLDQVIADSLKNVATGSNQPSGSESHIPVQPNENDILNLTQMGFSREESIKALNEASGDANKAAAILLARTIANK
uniref:UBA domain-containing protein n=1 Tax=Romanomermis culicivorax TaxID=13658 RepID=A0A915JXS1_ROMCU